jgi:DHA1 family multidrug resistance protein-like MFS transporter
LAVGVAGVTAFVLAFLLLTEKKKPFAEPVSARKVTLKMFHGWGEIARSRGALVVSFVQASQYYVYAAVEFFIVGYAIGVAKLDAFYAGIILTVEVATIIISRPFLGRLSDKKGRRIPIILGSLISGLLVFAVPFTMQFGVLLLIAVGYGLGFAMVISSTSPLMCDLAPSGLVGSSMGFLATTMDIGQTIGPILSGFVLASVFQYNGLFASLGLLLLATSAIFALSKVAKTKPKQRVEKNSTET